MSLATIDPRGESTLIDFYSQQSTELDRVARNVLNFLARSLMERGWLPSVDNMIEQLSDEYPAQLLPDVLADLKRRRLLKTDFGGKRVTDFLGGISLTQTPHRAEIDPGSGNFLYTYGGLELLAIGPIFGKPVECMTKCGHTGKSITLTVRDEQIVDASPVGIAGFASNWDGKGPIASVAKNSPLFADDQALEAWTSENAHLDGLPLSADLLLFVGMGMMQASGDARHKCISG